MNNDFVGHTDKYMTGNFSAGFIKNSWALYYSHRLFTPATMPYYGAKDFLEPKGVFTDDLSFNFFKVISYHDLLIDLGLGFDHLGENGARSLARRIHNQLGSPTIPPKQDFQKGDYMNYNFQISHHLFKSPSFKGGLGVRDDFLLTDYYIFLQYTKELKTFKFSLAHYRIRQQSSSLDEKSYRNESTLGVGIGKYYRIYLHYVSSYIKGDPRGQVYLSPLNFQYEW